MGFFRVRVLGYGFGVRGRKVKSRDCALASDLVRAKMQPGTQRDATLYTYYTVHVARFGTPLVKPASAKMRPCTSIHSV